MLAAVGALGLLTSACVTVMGEEPASTASDATTAASPAASPVASLLVPTASARPTEAPSDETTTSAEDPIAQPTEPPVEPTEVAPLTDEATPAASVSSEPTASASPTPTVAPTPAEPAIGYMALDGSQAYVQAVSAGMREAAAAAGMKLVECDAGWKRTGVRICARKLANAGVTGIISMQPFGDLAEEVCETIGNVPAIGIVYEQGSCQVSLLQVDQAESGRLAGAALGALAAKRWDCNVKAYVSLESGADDPIGGARMQGYREGFEEHCQMPKKKVTLNDAQHLITAQTQMASVLDDVSGKPIIVAESASNDVGGGKAAWIADGYREVYAKLPRIVAINYLNVDLRHVGHPDWRLTTPPWALDKYAEVAALPEFSAKLTSKGVRATKIGGKKDVKRTTKNASGKKSRKNKESTPAKPRPRPRVEKGSAESIKPIKDAAVKGHKAKTTKKRSKRRSEPPATLDMSRGDGEPQGS